MTELMIPPAVNEDQEAFEILRVWASKGEQHVTIHSGLNGDASDFGVMLADLAYHGANLYSEKFSVSLEESLKNIVKGFQDQINDNDHETTGEILK